MMEFYDGRKLKKYVETVCVYSAWNKQEAKLVKITVDQLQGSN